MNLAQELIQAVINGNKDAIELATFLVGQAKLFSLTDEQFNTLVEIRKSLRQSRV